MNDIDGYLEREYLDPEYRRYQIQTSQPGLVSRLLWWAGRIWGSWRPARNPLPLFEGEQPLDRSQIKVWSVDSRGAQLHCVSGCLWLTKTGDPGDTILERGQNQRLEPGQWVVQALTPSRIRVYSATTEEVPHGQARLLSAF